MAAYTKSQNFTALRGQDSDPAVFDTEFTLVQNATVNTMDKTGGAFTGPITVPAGATGMQVPNANDIYNHSFATGTVMAFFQAAAPIGWAQVSSPSQNDALLRVVSGVGGGVGGVDSIAAGMPAGVTGGHVLTIAEMPAHTHTVPLGLSANTGNQIAGANYANAGPSTSSSTGGGAAHTHTTPTWAPKYIDMILARKN